MYGIHPLVVFDNDDQNTSFSEFNPFIIPFKQDVKVEKDLTGDLVYAKEQVQIMKEVFEKIHKHEIGTVLVAEKQPQGIIDRRLTVAMRKQQYERMSKQLVRRVEMYKQGIMEDHDFFKNYAFPLREHQWILQQPASANSIQDAYYIHLIMDYKVLLRRHDKVETSIQHLQGNYQKVVHRPYLSVYFPLPKSMLKVQFRGLTYCYEIPYPKNRLDAPIDDILIGLHDCQASILLQDVMHRLVLEARNQKSRPFKGEPLTEVNDVVVDEIKETIYWEWKYPDIPLIQFTLYIGHHDEMQCSDVELLPLITFICKKCREFQDNKEVGLFSSLQENLSIHINKKHVQAVLDELKVFTNTLPFKFELNQECLVLFYAGKKAKLEFQNFITFSDIYKRTFDIRILKTYLIQYLKQHITDQVKSLQKGGNEKNRFSLKLEGYKLILKSYYNGDIIIYSRNKLQTIEIDLQSENLEKINELIL